ncbi:MAG: acyl-CoA dehydrogenase family protein, partial [Cyanobacteria bacterium P01_E01_bin.35]
VGYWNNKKLTEEKFQARVNNSNKFYLRTGDLGFIADGELFVTGRVKDVIIIRGQNYYPQDIERVVERSHSALRANAGATFSVEIEGKEQLVIVQEVARSFVRKLFGRQRAESKEQELTEEIESAIKSAVSQEFGLNIYDIQLIKTGSISKTSSGKIQRYLCKENYLKEVTKGLPACSRKGDSVSRMQSEVNSEKVQFIIDWLRGYAEENVNSQLIDERRCIPPYIVLDFGNQGLLGMQVPQEYGGLGLNNYETMQILEQLGAIDTTLCLFVGLNNILGIRPILNYGSEELKQELLPILATGRELAAFALTEKGAGSNPQAISSKAIASGEHGWNIEGEKIWSGSAAWAGVTNVFVQHEDINGSHRGISAFAVRRGTPGLRQGKEALTMGMKGMVQNTVYFDNVPVDLEQLLGKPGKGMEVAQDAMMYGRLAISFSCLGGMKRCAQLMLRYTSRRQVSTGRLLDNPVILNRLGELTAQIAAVECLVTQIAELLDEGVVIPVELYAACKTSAPEFYWQAADSLVQFLGGRGYIETNIAPQILRDARVLRIFEGPTETLNMFLGSRIVNCNNLAQSGQTPRRRKAQTKAQPRKGRRDQRRFGRQPCAACNADQDRRKDAKKNTKNEIENLDRELAVFMQDTFNAADVYEELEKVIARINKHFQDNPVFDKSIDNKRWIYSLVGEVATCAILLAATKHSYQQNPTQELKRAVSWAELQFEEEIAKAIASHELVTQEADATRDLIKSYENAIGDIQQNLAGEDREVDELLGFRRQRAEGKNPLPITHYPLPITQNKPVTPTKQQKSSEVEDWLSRWLSGKLQIPMEKIDRTKAFADYGIDSVMAVELAQDLQEWLPEDLEIEPTLAWSFPSIEALAGYLARQRTENRGQREQRDMDIDALSEDELARSLLQEIALAKGRDN